MIDCDPLWWIEGAYAWHEREWRECADMLRSDFWAMEQMHAEMEGREPPREAKPLRTWEDGRLTPLNRLDDLAYHQALRALRALALWHREGRS